MKPVYLNLYKDYFSEKEKIILQSGNLSASAFIFSTGVHGLRVRNAKGELVILPFQGQQIWSAYFCGRDLTMKSVFPYPFPTLDYLRTYGGFLIHCGATAMGVPSDKDNHPLHGELPNIPYREAYIRFGKDEGGRYLAVGGKAEYKLAFSVDYTAEPEIKLYEEDSVFQVTMSITNLRSHPMEYMYLCHINFRPFDGSRLVYSAPADKEHIKVHFTIPNELPALKKNALRAYMQQIAENPQIHNVVDPNTQVYDPEIVLTVKYLADRNGYAHSMQVMPDGDACYVAFMPDQLPIGIRWISRTGDEDAMGLVLPATAEHMGYLDAKKNGWIRTIGPKKRITMTMKAGYLDKENASRMKNTIISIIGSDCQVDKNNCNV